MKHYGKIAVFAGGPSSERKISLRSGKAVCEALRRAGEDTDFVDVGYDIGEKLKSIKADIVFIALHGKFGEDGSVQAILEEAELPYTGSGVCASKLALDKVASRELFLAGGLKTPTYKTISSSENADEVLKHFRFPLVVKPQHSGSSIGLSVVKKLQHAKTAIDHAFNHSENVIIEEYIKGRELTVGILDGKALPVVEIVPEASGIYDFDAKYLDEGTKYIVPADLRKDRECCVREYAVKAHSILGCRDFSRVDMRMDSDGNIYVLEINTIPGLTERSLLPKAAFSAGLTFEDLCIKLVDLANRRRGRKDGQK